MDSNASSLYDTGSTASSATTAINIIFLLVVPLFFLAISVFLIVAVWKMYRKANKPGWASIIPFYNTIVLLEIVGRPIWWIILTFIPFVNLYVSFVISLDLAKSFGKSTGFGVANFFVSFITFPMLAFSKSTHYLGPIAEGLDTFAPAPDRAMTPPQVNADGQPIAPTMTGAPQQPAAPTPSGQPVPPPFTPPVQQPPQAPSDPTQPRPPQF